MTGGHRAIIFGFLPQNLKTIAVAVAFIEVFPTRLSWTYAA
jgi:hypothetical protein